MPPDRGRGGGFLPVDEGQAGSDKLISAVGHSNVIDGGFAGPVQLPCLCGQSRPRGGGGQVADVHVERHGHGAVGVGRGLESLVDQGEQRPAVRHSEDVLHVGGEVHLDFRVARLQRGQPQPEFFREGLLPHLPENRLPDLFVHHALPPGFPTPAVVDEPVSDPPQPPGPSPEG